MATSEHPATRTHPAAAAAPVTLFYSYAHEDEALRDELQDHLAILERRGVIRSWHDRAIVPGHDWSQEIDSRLRSADLVLLLLSKDFIASDYIMGIELDLAMARQQRGEATVVPVLLRPVDLQPEDAQDLPFVSLLKPQGLPRDLKPVTTWANRDEAWTQVASGLRRTVNDIRARRSAAVARQDAVTVSVASVAQSSMSTPTASDWMADAGSAAIERVIDDVQQRVVQATLSKGGAVPDADALRTQLNRLLDAPQPPRVLWVDDHPSNNRAETAALARLQIEVVAVRSSEEALARLDAAAAEGPAFDLVISDWSRDAEGALAGIRLLVSMRTKGHTQALVYYHGTFGAVQRAALAATAKAAGALGEATLPAELLQWVLKALDR